MRHLSLDIETYSPADLASVGAYAYAQSGGFRVLLCAYAWDDGPVEVADVVHGGWPPELVEAVLDPDVVKHAFNASFERVCLSAALLPRGEYIAPESWRCTMVQAAYWGVPGSLKQVADVLGLDERKDARGRRLIRSFSTPAKDGQPPLWFGEDWDLFLEYCRQDVVVEREIQRALGGPIPEAEQEAYAADQRINDRGAGIDVALARQASAMSHRAAEGTVAYLKEATGLENPNSAAQFKGWLNDHGVAVGSVGRQVLEDALAAGVPAEVEPVVRARLDSAKSSVKKFDSALAATCPDGRIHGCFQFYGAQTGRWAGRIMQLQNLPRGDLHGESLDLCRGLVKTGDYEGVEMLFGNVPSALKSLIRTAIAPTDPSLTLVVCDYSAIEARVVAWLAGEEEVLEVFRTTGKIYEATASRMFGVPADSVDKALRQKGKVATLALGYGGGPKALERMGALRMGMSQDELPEIVRAWRRANRGIVRLWRDVERAAQACAEGSRQSANVARRLVVRREPACNGVAIELPSGRALHYRRMRFDDENELCYSTSGRGAGQVTVRTYGGRLVENIVQAVARDLLANALVSLERSGYRTVAHIHDEVVVEVPRSAAREAYGKIRETMCDAPEWADGLPLDADGYICDSYRKE